MKSRNPYYKQFYELIDIIITIATIITPTCHRARSRPLRTYHPCAQTPRYRGAASGESPVCGGVRLHAFAPGGAS